MSEWMRFEPMDVPNGKTAVVRVLSKTRVGVLGTIRWYGAWRQYVFYPSAGCLFNAGCLEDINMELRRLQQEWRKKRSILVDGRPLITP